MTDRRTLALAALVAALALTGWLTGCHTDKGTQRPTAPPVVDASDISGLQLGANRATTEVCNLAQTMHEQGKIDTPDAIMAMTIAAGRQGVDARVRDAVRVMYPDDRPMHPGARERSYNALIETCRAAGWR